MAIVLSTHALHPNAAALIEKVARLDIAKSWDAEVLIAAAREADIIIVRAPLPAALFDHAPWLRAAIRHGAGIDMIPLEAASRAGVLVANVPGANARSVAEHVIFSTLALVRRFRTIDEDLRSVGWNRAREHATATHEIRGMTIGLIGLGRVGREVSKMARALEMSVVAFKPSTNDVPEDVALKPLESVLSEADVLVVCCPLTEATRGMLNAARLSLMKPTAFLINVARGAVIVESDLLRALDAGKLAGAALDVFCEQPKHPLFARRNVVLTPHVAGITEESMERMGIGAAQEAMRVLKGEVPVNLVNPEAIEAYRARFG